MKNLNEGFDWFFYKGSCERPVLTEQLLNDYRWPKPKKLLLEPVDQLKSWILYYLNKCFVPVHPGISQFDTQQYDPESVSYYKSLFKDYAYAKSLFKDYAYTNFTTYMKYKINMEIFKDVLNTSLRNVTDKLAKHYVDSIKLQVEKQGNDAAKDKGPFFIPKTYFSNNVYTMENKDWVTLEVRLGFNYIPKGIDLNQNIFNVSGVTSAMNFREN